MKTGSGTRPLEELTMDANGLFTARIGSFVIAGPHKKNFACTMGIPCVFDIPGVRDSREWRVGRQLGPFSH